MKKYKDTCTVTEAAFPLPDPLVTLEVRKPLCSPAEGPEISALISTKSVNVLCPGYALLTNFFC